MTLPFRAVSMALEISPRTAIRVFQVSPSLSSAHAGSASGNWVRWTLIALPSHAGRLCHTSSAVKVRMGASSLVMASRMRNMALWADRRLFEAFPDV